MSDLEEKIKIKFPIAIEAKETKETLLEYIRDNVHCDIQYELRVGGYKNFGSGPQRDYISLISFWITKPRKHTLPMGTMLWNGKGLFEEIEFEKISGGIVGRRQVEFLAEVRSSVESYFSNRKPKEEPR